MDIAINLIGGLGLFLYGMNLMGEGLQKSAGTKLKKIIELLTSNILMGVLVGTAVTAIYKVVVQLQLWLLDLLMQE